MDILLNKFASKINSVLTGFDRIAFKGIIRPIVYTVGMESFLVVRNILNKDCGRTITSDCCISGAYFKRPVRIGLRFQRTSSTGLPSICLLLRIRPGWVSCCFR